MVTDLAYLPDGKSLLAVYQEIGIVLWDLETGKPVRVMDDSHQCMTFATTSDGKWVLGGRISLWEVATGKKAITMETKVDPILWTTNEA